MTFARSCDRLYPVSEGNRVMKNTMTLTEIRRHFEQRRQRAERIKKEAEEKLKNLNKSIDSEAKV